SRPLSRRAVPLAQPAAGARPDPVRVPAVSQALRRDRADRQPRGRRRRSARAAGRDHRWPGRGAPPAVLPARHPVPRSLQQVGAESGRPGADARGGPVRSPGNEGDPGAGLRRGPGHLGREAGPLSQPGRGPGALSGPPGRRLQRAVGIAARSAPSSKASWRARTASSVYLSSITHDTAISDVEIIWMLMRSRDSVWNIRAATPEWLRMPTPTIETLATRSSWVTPSAPMRPAASDRTATAFSRSVRGSVNEMSV